MQRVELLKAQRFMPEKKLSTLERGDTLNKLTSEKYDLLIIGGGITGAGVALDAVTRGLKVALIEKRDFGWGTSSRSTKLIHGGLRYLKQLEINLVREVGKERAIIYRNAPHIVHPENMLLPIVKKGSLGKHSTSVGLYVYDMLAGVKRRERRVMLDRYQTLKYEPLLREDIILGGGLYKEYRTDDARLVIEVMKTACKHGADIINYVRAEEFMYDKGRAVGVEATDMITGEPVHIHATKVVNAAGPWVDELRTLDNSVKRKRLHLTKGVHIVLPYNKLPLQQAVYFDVEDGRMVFAIPRDKVTYVGTTDTSYQQQIDEPHTNADDVEYLVKAINYMFPDAGVKASDVTSSWAGLRPLIHEEGKGPSELSRKDELFLSDSGVIAIAGGKLTGFRKMAERTVDMVVEHLKSQRKEFKPCTTHKIKISGGDFKDPKGIDKLIDHVQAETGLDAIEARILVEKYGTNTMKILNRAAELSSRFPKVAERLLAAELYYTIEEEMVTQPADFFIRRTGKLYFEREEIEGDYPIVMQILHETLNYTSSLQTRYEEEFEKDYKQVISFA